MFVSPRVNDISINNKNVKLDYKTINSVKFDDLIKETDINTYKRTITIFNSNAKLQYLDTETPEEYVLVENLVIHDRTPLAFDYFYNDIEKSLISSSYLFVRKAEPDVNTNKNDLYLLYGFANGYGVHFAKELNWINYGISVLDKVNEFSDSNVTYTFDNKGLFDPKCEYLGSIIPNIYTEEHFELLTKEKYKYHLNPVYDTYRLADLIDDKTFIRHVNFNPIYVNEFEPEGDFYTMDNFMNICFLILNFNITNIDIIYDAQQGLNCKNIIRNIDFFKDKTSIDMISFLKELEKKLVKICEYYNMIDHVNKKDYSVYISIDENIFGLTIKNKYTDKHLCIKLSKAEMMERILSGFYMNKLMLINVNRALLLEKEEDYFKQWRETITFDPSQHKDDLFTLNDFSPTEFRSLF